MKKTLTLTLKLLKWLILTCLCLVIILIAIPFAINMRDEALNESAKKWQAELQQLNVQKAQYSNQTQALFGFLSQIQINYDALTPPSEPKPSKPAQMGSDGKYLPPEIPPPPVHITRNFGSVEKLMNEPKLDQIILKHQGALDQYATMLEKKDLIKIGLNDIDAAANDKLYEISILFRANILKSLQTTNSNNKNSIQQLKKDIDFYRAIAEKTHTRNWIILSQYALEEDLSLLQTILDHAQANAKNEPKIHEAINLKDILSESSLFLNDITKLQARAAIEPPKNIEFQSDGNYFVKHFIEFSYQPQATANLVSECVDALQENHFLKQTDKLYFLTFKAFYNAAGKIYHDENCAGISGVEVLKNSVSDHPKKLEPTIPQSIAMIRQTRLKLNIHARSLFVKNELNKQHITQFEEAKKFLNQHPNWLTIGDIVVFNIDDQEKNITLNLLQCMSLIEPFERSESPDLTAIFGKEADTSLISPKARLPFKKPYSYCE